MSLSRRQLFGLSAAGLLVPRGLWGRSGTDRKFLFVFAPGGWDPCYLFAPLWDAPYVDMPSEGETYSSGNLSWVASGSRPSVDLFMETWGSQTCMIHGLYVPSIAHEVCRRIIMTGSTNPGVDGWDATVAGHAVRDLPMPMVHMTGPTFVAEQQTAVVRMGLDGQLPALLTGSALEESTLPASMPRAEVQAFERAYAKARAQAVADAAPATGWSRRVADAHALSLDRLDDLATVAPDLELSGESTFVDRAHIVGECFEQGLSRCGIVAHDGYREIGWDTHNGNSLQSLHFEELFADLLSVMDDLASRKGSGRHSLLDETTIVVLSEMGRYPVLNNGAGKDHWTWTGAMLIGAGVRGDQMIGSWTDECTGDPVDLASGESTDSGVTLTAGHLGATLLALADIDPGEHVAAAEAEPIEAVLA